MSYIYNVLECLNQNYYECAAAKQIVELGHFPDTLEGIKALKGVGDYTAAAIGSLP